MPAETASIRMMVSNRSLIPSVSPRSMAMALYHHNDLVMSNPIKNGQFRQGHYYKPASSRGNSSGSGN